MNQFKEGFRFAYPEGYAQGYFITDKRVAPYYYMSAVAAIKSSPVLWSLLRLKNRSPQFRLGILRGFLDGFLEGASFVILTDML